MDETFRPAGICSPTYGVIRMVQREPVLWDLRALAEQCIPALRQRVGDPHGQFDDGARGAPDAAVTE